MSYRALLYTGIITSALAAALPFGTLAPLPAVDATDPLASLPGQFRLQQQGSGSGLSASKGSLPKWLEKPPWWLPTPPEWGPPPAHMYGSWYDPRNIPQVMNHRVRNKGTALLCP